MAKRIVLVAGEVSGDLIGAALIRSMKERWPDAEFSGIAGPNMIAEGCRADYPTEKLSVMGLVEVLADLKEILSIRNRLFEKLQKNPPDIFIGIDAPDFNLPLERRLKQAGICKTVHYVSPSVWAWRQKRIHKIRKSVDLMLTLFPFEAEFYERHDVPVKFVGHPLADIFPMEPDTQAARQELGIDGTGKVLAVLPGSRKSEVTRLSPVFLQTVAELKQQDPSLQVICPLASEKTKHLFQVAMKEYAPDLDIRIVDGNSRTVMTAADVILLASGTAALEGLLVKKPMVVAYRMNALTYWILKKFNILKIDTYSLPNLLAGKIIAKEYIQGEATVGNLLAETSRLLEAGDDDELQTTYVNIHKTLKRDASNSAAGAIAELLDD